MMGTLVGILSDTHNDGDSTERALQYFRGRGVRTLFHCGDLTTAEMVPRFEDFVVHFVRGNMDRHVVKALKSAIAVQSGAQWLGKGREVDLDGRRIAITHGDRPDLFETLLFSEPDFLFTGHTHRRRDELVGPTRIINPGALGGVEYETRSVAVLDLASGQLQFVEV